LCKEKKLIVVVEKQLEAFPSKALTFLLVWTKSKKAWCLVQTKALRENNNCPQKKGWCFFALFRVTELWCLAV